MIGPRAGCFSHVTPRRTAMQHLRQPHATQLERCQVQSFEGGEVPAHNRAILGNGRTF